MKNGNPKMVGLINRGKPGFSSRDTWPDYPVVYNLI